MCIFIRYNGHGYVYISIRYNTLVICIFIGYNINTYIFYHGLIICTHGYLLLDRNIRYKYPPTILSQFNNMYTWVSRVHVPPLKTWHVWVYTKKIHIEVYTYKETSWVCTIFFCRDSSIYTLKYIDYVCRYQKSKINYLVYMYRSTSVQNILTRL